jgi:hypothetical protein
MSKLDDLRKQNPLWDISIFDLIKKSDPSDSNRYVSFLFKLLKNSVPTPEDFVQRATGISDEELQKFHQWHTEGLIEKKDILTYKTLNDFKEQMTLAEEKVRIREAERQVTKLFEDDQWLLMRPESYDAARIYGANTRWCITQKRYWEDYQKYFYFIYIIDKKGNQKFCVSKDTRYVAEYKCWWADDAQKNIIELPLPPQHYAVLFGELKNNNRPVGRPVDDDQYWTKADGTRIKIEEMSTQHIKNTIAKFQFNTNPSIQQKLGRMQQVLDGRQATEQAIVQRPLSQSVVETMRTIQSVIIAERELNWLEEYLTQADDEDNEVEEYPF